MVTIIITHKDSSGKGSKEKASKRKLFMKLKSKLVLCRPSGAKKRYIKALLLSLYIAVAPWQMLATPVNSDKASKVAETFLNQEKARWNNNPKTVPEKFRAKGSQTAVQAHRLRDIRAVEEKGLASAYVAELDPEGFVIISADDEIEPLLGFSFQGQFPFPESGHNALLHLVKWDTAGRLKALQKAKAKGIATKQAMLATAKWASFLSPVKTGGPQPWPRPRTYQQWPANQDGWLTTTWNQNSPYNDDCPLYIANGASQGPCAVGCVATAMSQIINYWQYPSSVSFSSSDAYTSHGYTPINIDADASTYGFPTFSQLNSDLSTISYNPLSDAQLAALCFGAGVKLQMAYGIESGAYCSDAAYKNGFSYGSAHLVSGPIAWTLAEAEVIQNIKNGLFRNVPAVFH